MSSTARAQAVAASNWNRPDSFIGENLSYRPYFVEAVEGRPGRFFGVGITRGEPGYYLSSPLTEDGKTVGVAVVKVSLEQLEQSWATVEAPALVSDENGVVILASTPSWKFTTLRPSGRAGPPPFREHPAIQRPPSAASRPRPRQADRGRRGAGPAGAVRRRSGGGVSRLRVVPVPDGPPARHAMDIDRAVAGQPDNRHGLDPRRPGRHRKRVRLASCW